MAIVGGQELFDRRAVLTIAVPVDTPGDYSHFTFDRVQIGNTEGDTSLQVAFNIKKALEKDPNPAEIKVTNLSPTRRASLERKGAKLLLEVGYASTGVSRIYVGDVRNVDHVRSGADWITTLKAGDGERAFRFARLNDSFAGGTSAGDVLRKLADAMGLQVGNVPDQAPKLAQRFDHGYVVAGPVQRSIDRLVRSLGYTWSVQDGQLQVLAPGEALALAIPELSPTTGLIGSPQMGSPEKKGGPGLVKFKALILPLRPAGKVRLKSERYDGEVRLKKVTFDGDTHGDNWYVDCEGLLASGSSGAT